MTYPSLAEITDCSNHLHSHSKLTCMLYNAIPALLLTLCLTTMTAHGQFLLSSAEVAEGSVLLKSLALITCHEDVTGKVDHGLLLYTACLDRFLALLHLVCLLTGSGLLFRHAVCYCRIKKIKNVKQSNLAIPCGNRLASPSIPQPFPDQKDIQNLATL